jgi:transposase
LRLRAERIGPLPIVNHFLARLGLEELLAKHVPSDARSSLPHAKALSVLLRSILVEREPIYRQQETVRTYAPGTFGLEGDETEQMSDDRLGRALDHLFDADRGALLTEVVVAVGRVFAVRFDQLHNDSTSVRFSGQYRDAHGRSIRGRRAPWITYGYSKDHRPDLKQLLFVLTTSADGGIPVQFRCHDGNVSDSVTHVETWEALRRVTGRADFLYVADSKLCSRECMDPITQAGGRFVTVIPRSRSEDAHFREWIQTNVPVWETVWNRPNPRRKYGPRDVWRVCRAPLPSREAWPVTWVSSALLTLHQEHRRHDRLARALQDLDRLKRRLATPRTRLRKRSELKKRVDGILRRMKVGRYLKVRLLRTEEPHFRQERRGRPGPNTRYRKLIRHKLDLAWELDQAAIDYDRKSDGMYPLLTNDRALTARQVLVAHKGQPAIEKRFRQMKAVYEIAPVLLKNEARVEAFFLLYFLALLVQALIERELRSAMLREGIRELPLYPEERRCRQPSTEQVLRLFSLVERHSLLQGERWVPVLPAEITDLQKQVLRLLDVPANAYRAMG